MQAVPPTRLLRPDMHLISDSERGSAAADIGVKSIRHQLKARLHSAAAVAQPAGGNVLNVQINKLTNKQSFVIDQILFITRDHMLPTLKINKNSFLNFENFDQTCQVVYCPHSRFAARRST